MPRRARISLAGVPHHIIQRGNNRDACFYCDQDYQIYLEWLHEYADLYGCQVHAYVLMTNHVHILITPETNESLGLMMRRLGQRYVQYINRTYKRSGTLWEGRFKSCITHEATYVLACYRYIELNPVRANMVEHPAEYEWSSYRVNAQGENNNLIIPQDFYLDLGLEVKKRLAVYRTLFKDQLNAKLINEIRESTNGNYELGSALFKQQVEAAIGRRVTKGKPGRPRLRRDQ
jgi:putative transposase